MTMKAKLSGPAFRVLPNAKREPRQGGPPQGKTESEGKSDDRHFNGLTGPGQSFRSFRTNQTINLYDKYS